MTTLDELRSVLIKRADRAELVPSDPMAAYQRAREQADRPARRAGPVPLVVAAAAAIVFLLIGALALLELTEERGSTVITDRSGTAPVVTPEELDPAVDDSDEPEIDIPSSSVVEPSQTGYESVLTTTFAGPAPPAATCPVGTRSDIAGPTDQPRPPSTGGSIVPDAAFDRHTGVVVMVVAGQEINNQTWTLDICSNTWTQAATPPESATYHGAVVYDVDSDRVVVLPSGSIGSTVTAYDADTDTWTIGSAMPQGVAPSAGALYDPVSGLIVTGGADGWFAYDVDTDRWSDVPLKIGDHALDADAGISTGVLLAHIPDADRFVVWAEPMATVDVRSGEIIHHEVDNPELVYGFPPPLLTYTHDSAGLGIIHTLGGGELHGFDPSALDWIELSDAEAVNGPGSSGIRGFDTLVYDSLNERLVAVGGIVRVAGDWLDIDATWAFDVASGKWTLLVPESP